MYNDDHVMWLYNSCTCMSPYLVHIKNILHKL